MVRVSLPVRWCTEFPSSAVVRPLYRFLLLLILLTENREVTDDCSCSRGPSCCRSCRLVPLVQAAAGGTLRLHVLQHPDRNQDVSARIVMAIVYTCKLITTHSTHNMHDCSESCMKLSSARWTLLLCCISSSFCTSSLLIHGHLRATRPEFANRIPF